MSARPKNLVQRRNRSVDLWMRPATGMGRTLATTILASVAALGTRAHAQCEQAKLVAWDAGAQDYFGDAVGISGDIIVVGAAENDDAGSGSGSAYVFRRVDASWVQTQKLVPSDAAAGDRFGWSVAVSGGWVLVAGPFDNSPLGDAGSVWVYQWNGMQWAQHQKLTASDATFGGQFGWSVAIQGDVAAVGAFDAYGTGFEFGAIYVFRRNGTTWTQEQKLVHSDPSYANHLGHAVAVSGNTVAGSAPGMAPRGAVYVFRWNGATWSEEQKLTASGADPSEPLRVVALRGDTLMAGAEDYGVPALGNGSVYVFRRQGGAWSQTQRLIASDGQPGDAFGWSVALGFETAIVGARFTDGAGSASGSAYIFRWNGSQWVQSKKIAASDATGSDSFGGTVGIDGFHAVVGAPGADGCPNEPFCASGAAYAYDVPICIFGIPAMSPLALAILGVLIATAGVIVVPRRNRSVGPQLGPAMGMPCTLATATLLSIAALGTRAHAQCEQSKLTASDAACGDYFGVSVAIEGDVTVVATPGDDHVGTDAGSAYVFRKIGSNWIQQQKLIASDAGPGDRFGSGVAISQNRILVGADYASSPDNMWNGFAYVFRWTGTAWVEEQKLVPSDPQLAGHFGCSVSLHGDVAAVAAIHEYVGGGDESGAVYMFRRSGTTWLQEQKIIPSDVAPFDYFGTSVAVYGDVVVVGSRLDDPYGSAYVFRWNGAAWVQEQKLTPSDGTPYFGVSVSIYGDRLIVGADDNSDPAFGPGAAFVYRWTGTSWVEEDKLTASDGDPGDAFGRSVAIRGNRAVVGSYGHPQTGNVTGASYVFRRSTGRWSQGGKLGAFDARASDAYGLAISMTEESIIVGAPFRDDASLQNPFCQSGAAYIYDVRLCLTAIPALSAWGVIIMLLGLVGAGIIVIKRQSRLGAW